jgi:AcrR family transcriptional regulator
MASQQGGTGTSGKRKSRPRARPATRRTEGVHVGGRAREVVEKAMRATAEELSSAGYAAFRVENVAARCGVNKTTLYRRWPTKADLISAALAHEKLSDEPPDTGTLRGDLVAMLAQSAKRAASPIGRGFIRILQMERAEPGVEELARALRRKGRALRETVVERGIARGELPQGTSARLVSELVFTPLYARLIASGEPVDAVWAEAVVDVVLAGAKAGKACLPP